MWRKENPPTRLVGIKLVQSLRRKVWRFLKKTTKIELPYDLVISFLSIQKRQNSN